MSTIQLKRGTSIRLSEVNPVLAAGEPCVERDTGKMKIGDGITPWNKLRYVGGNTEIVTAATKDLFPEVGDANCLYKASDEKSLYQWNNLTGEYESLSSGGSSFDPSTIKIINGGTA